ncbi:MAG: hypothetical protein H6724_00635 [Sandaracinus sp.]|nr:hypothetical protein [Sandaracinus sp.]
MLHEVHHVVLGHLTHPKYFGVAHPELLSMAMEASANEYVDEALPSPLLWEHFREVGFRARQSTMERYELLVAARADGEEPRPSRPSRTLDPHDWVNEATAPATGVEHARQVITRARDEGEGDAKRMEVRVPRLAGKTPDQLLLELVGTDRAPAKRVDWRRALQDLVAQGRAPHSTWARPSRRFPAQVGVAPGRTFRSRAVPRSTFSWRSTRRRARRGRARGDCASAAADRGAGARRGGRVRRRGAPADVSVSRHAVGGDGTWRHGPSARVGRAFLAGPGARGWRRVLHGWRGPAPEVAPSVPVLWVLTKATGRRR